VGETAVDHERLIGGKEEHLTDKINGQGKLLATHLIGFRRGHPTRLTELFVGRVENCRNADFPIFIEHSALIANAVDRIIFIDRQLFGCSDGHLNGFFRVVAKAVISKQIGYF